MQATYRPNLHWRTVDGNQWLSKVSDSGAELQPRPMIPEVLPSEDAVGHAMLEEVRTLASRKAGPLVVILLGGRGGQAFHRKLGALALANDELEWISRLHLFMQDALAPMPSSSTLSFVYDFRRLLGPALLNKVAQFHVLRTEAPDPAEELKKYVGSILELGGADIFFIGHGPEPADASHFAYVRPGSGAQSQDLAGVIPIASSLVEHHIAKFRAGGIEVSAEDERECRRATHILTFGPAMLLAARRVVQSIVDADTAPAKKRSYARVVNTEFAADPVKLRSQLDENPGLWARLHPNFRSLILPNVLAGK